MAFIFIVYVKCQSWQLIDKYGIYRVARLFYSIKATKHLKYQEVKNIVAIFY